MDGRTECTTFLYCPNVQIIVGQYNDLETLYTTLNSYLGKGYVLHNILFPHPILVECAHCGTIPFKSSWKEALVNF